MWAEGQLLRQCRLRLPWVDEQLMAPLRLSPLLAAM